MGLFGKLKNILFEEEEIEEEVVENHPHQRKLVKQEDDTQMMELPKISKEPEKKEKAKEFDFKEYDFEEETDKDLFESERTFDFPAFDEDEFDDLLPKREVVEKKEKPQETIEEKYKKDLEPPKRRNDFISVRMEIPKEEVKKLFKPSPVISPVYGILDKNYRKEDIITRDEKLAGEKIKLDVDSVRKKAFGTLEENLDNSIVESAVTFYEDVEEKIDDNDVVEAIEEEKLDNLLEDTVDVEIDVTKEMELPSRSDKKQESDDDIDEVSDTEEVIEEENIEFEEVEEVKEEPKEEKENNDSDENDLFELIDSMYENKEDE